MRMPLVVPFWNRGEYLFPLLVSLTRACIRPEDVYLCEDTGSAPWIARDIRERFGQFQLLQWPAAPDPQADAPGKPWAKGQWHCVRSVNRVLEEFQQRCGPPPAFFYVESDCLVARSVFTRLQFFWQVYNEQPGWWQPLARIGAYRGRSWAHQRTYQPAPWQDRDWVEDIHGGCWFGLINAELWRRYMIEGLGHDGPYDPRRPECDFADSFFDRQCSFGGARFLRTTRSLIQHQGMVNCVNPHHWPADDFVGEQA